MSGITTDSPALFTKGTDDWATPQGLFDWLDLSFGFSLDPCATAESAKCADFFTRADNGLSIPWGFHRVFMNPPYSQVGKWMAKAYQEAQTGATVVCLVAARTDTKWFQQWVVGKANEIQFLPGRVSFLREGADAAGAPFPSVIVVYRPPVLREYLRGK